MRERIVAWRWIVLHPFKAAAIRRHLALIDLIRWGSDA